MEIFFFCQYLSLLRIRRSSLKTSPARPGHVDVTAVDFDQIYLYSTGTMIIYDIQLMCAGPRLIEIAHQLEEEEEDSACSVATDPN